jgi:hypothetical protein
MSKPSLHLSENEREALKAALFVMSFTSRPDRQDTLWALSSMLERSAPAKPSVRFVVKCQGFRRAWEKVFFDKTAAQQYARHAAETWCGREGVRIMKQKWIAF